MVYIVHVCHIDDWKYCFELKQYPCSSALFTTTSWTIQYIDTLHLHVHVLHVHVHLSNIRVLQSYKIIMSLLSSVLLRVSSTSNNVRTKKTTIFRIAWYHVIMIMLYKPSISLKHDFFRIHVAWYHVIMMLSYSLVPCDNDAFI